MEQVHVCPVQHAKALTSWYRRIIHNPQRILRRYLTEGATVADLGCGPGFFTIPMAKIVGEKGKVYAYDIQPEMLQLLQNYAVKKNVEKQIIKSVCDSHDMGFLEKFDFILAFWMLHETPDYSQIIKQVAAHLKPNGHFLVSEPKFHVKKQQLQEVIDIAEDCGLKLVNRPSINFSRSALFTLK
jgi:2-polyprenyl-3-methyl-5-hydroxy-6-metoxy-1,4-benzoquinol methylase